MILSMRFGRFPHERGHFHSIYPNRWLKWWWSKAIEKKNEIHCMLELTDCHRKKMKWAITLAYDCDCGNNSRQPQSTCALHFCLVCSNELRKHMVQSYAWITVQTIVGSINATLLALNPTSLHYLHEAQIGERAMFVMTNLNLSSFHKITTYSDEKSFHSIYSIPILNNFASRLTQIVEHFDREDLPACKAKNRAQLSDPFPSISMNLLHQIAATMITRRIQ